jgi:hypothetical protein
VREEEPQIDENTAVAAEIIESLKELNLDVITPLEAMSELYRLKKKLMQQGGEADDTGITP